MAVLRYRKTSQVKLNIKQWLDIQFVNAGFYTNVASGDLSVYGTRKDLLTRVNDTTYESHYDNWVYQTDASGVNGYAPSLCSGCYVNDTWYTKGASPYEPVVDYANGRLLFDGTAIPAGATVSTIFSYKHVHFDFPESENINLLFSSPKHNLKFQPHNQWPSGIQRQVPIVVIDTQKRNSAPWQLGGGTKWEQVVAFHILANNEVDLDSIVDMLDTQAHKAIKCVDFNDAPQALTYQGDVAGTYRAYTDLQNDSSTFWTRLYINEAELTEKYRFYDRYRATVLWQTEFYRMADD